MDGTNRSTTEYGLYESLRTPIWLFQQHDHRLVYANPSARNLIENLLRVEYWVTDMEPFGEETNTIGHLLQKTLDNGDEEFECMFYAQNCGQNIGDVRHGSFVVSKYQPGNLLLVENRSLTKIDKARESNGLWEFITSCLPISCPMIVVYEESGRVFMSNSRAQERTMPEILKNRMQETLSASNFMPHVVDRTIVQKILIKLAKGQHFQCTTKVRLRDRIYHHFITVQKVKHPQTAQQLVVTCEMDISSYMGPTNLKRSLLEITEPRLHLQLQHLLGMSELLLETFLAKQLPTCCELLQESTDSLLKVVNMFDLLQFQDSHAEFNNIEFDPYHLVEDCVEFMACRARSKGLDISTTVSLDVPGKLIGDSRRIKQVVLNVLSNAVKFTTKGEIFAKVTVEKESANDVVLRIEVTDTGIGISKERLVSLFPDFLRVCSAFKTDASMETKLGLVISKQIVELMGGSMGVQSEVGARSTFWCKFVLEKAYQTIGPSYPFKNLSYRTAVNGPALILSPSAAEQNVLLHYLADWGIKALLASTAADGIKLCEEKKKLSQPMELVFASCLLPDAKPHQLLKQLQTMCGTESIYLITLTQKRRSDRFTPFLQTPIRRTKLHKCLETFRAWKKTSTAKKQEQMKQIEEATFQLKQKQSPSTEIKLLVVDDNALAQVFASRILGGSGKNKVETVANGAMAVEAFTKNSFDIILMDCQMPELDGYSATKQIRELEKETGGHVIIIAVTAMTMQEDRDRCFQMGMDDFLAKPVTRKGMLEKIEQWTQQIKITREEEEFGEFNQSLFTKAPRRRSLVGNTSQIGKILTAQTFAIGNAD